MKRTDRPLLPQFFVDGASPEAWMKRLHQWQTVAATNRRDPSSDPMPIRATVSAYRNAIYPAEGLAL